MGNSYNKESGYGKHTQSYPFMGGGQVFIVAKSAAAGRQILQDMFEPFAGVARYAATIDDAINQTVASRGDVIFVAPNHTETVSAASGITLDVAGVSVIGLGTGSNRPVLTFSATNASFVISAASCVVKNIVGTLSVNAVTNPFDVTASDVTLDIEWRDLSSSVEAVTAVRAVTVSRLTLNLVYRGFTAGSGVVRAVSLNAVTGARINIDAYGVVSTAWVNFVTVLSTNVVVTGTMYTQGITDFSRTVVDTITGSKWVAKFVDASAALDVVGGSGAALAGATNPALAATLTVPSADVVTNTNERDVIGNKTDAAVTAVGTTKSILAYAKGLITMNTVQSADSTNNAFAGDVVGNKTDAAVYTPGTTKSLAAYAKGTIDVVEKCVSTAAATIVSGTTQFTIAGGPIEIVDLVSICVTGNDGTASTLQWSADGTDGAATTITGASASLANALAGASVILQGTTLATAPTVNSAGPGINASGGVSIIVPAGILTTTVAVGSTTGTWKHFLRYKPLARGVTVV